ncbi:hypothetical protein NUU61_003806 [Penicillium alfredii]|uniref:Uncharacterized protein n=1 Tax=Penicillium alfredii TaxID=1506179 RepID=A0A9W9FK53_9EURO|nr:uncharacterized protein NUU61_003806 [Penicillium alfredii]KAJ5101584.1 hypothetical protein NUU61_003806 [Penicillium alfredii]
MNCGQFNYRPRKHKSSIKPCKSQTAEDLRAELALAHRLSSSARQESILVFLGTERDDPDFIRKAHPWLQFELRHTHTCNLIVFKALKIPNVPVAALQSSTPLVLSFKAGSYYYHSRLFFASDLQYLVIIACFYVQISQSVKLLLSYHHTIYLAERTYSDLKERLVKECRSIQGVSLVSYRKIRKA